MGGGGRQASFGEGGLGGGEEKKEGRREERKKGITEGRSTLVEEGVEAGMGVGGVLSMPTEILPGLGGVCVCGNERGGIIRQ